MSVNIKRFIADNISLHSSYNLYLQSSSPWLEGLPTQPCWPAAISLLRLFLQGITYNFKEGLRCNLSYGRKKAVQNQEKKNI